MILSATVDYVIITIVEDGALANKTDERTTVSFGRVCEFHWGFPWISCTMGDLATLRTLSS